MAMATARLGRMARPLLRAAMWSSEEGKRHGGGPVVLAAKAGASAWFGEVSRSAGRRTGGARREGPQSSRAAAMAEAVLGQAERRKWRNLGHGSSLGGSLGGFSTTGALAAGRAAMKVKSLDHVVLTVKNIEATCEFYSEVLGMEVVRFGASDGGTRVALAFGEQKINLHQVGKEFEPKAHRATAGSSDLCFVTDAPLDGMQKHIESSGVSILQGPVGRTGALGAIRSVYFRDPDLNLIEVSNYV